MVKEGIQNQRDDETKGECKRRKLAPLDSCESPSEDNPRLIFGNAPFVSEELLDVWQQKMVDLLEHQDRLKLAATCQALCRVVDGYCRFRLQQIVKEQKVDDGFQERIQARMIRNVEGRQQNLPDRYLLKACRGTYLYKFDMFPGARDASGQAVLSKDGIRLVAAGTLALFQRPPIGDPNWRAPILIYSWDMDKKRCIRVDEVPAEEDGQEFSVNSVFLMTDYIVTCTNRRILVHSVETGTLLLAYSHTTYVSHSVPKNETTVVFRDDDMKVHSLDIHKGTAQFVAQLQGTADLALIAVCSNRWLVVGDAGGPSNPGVRSLDLEDACREVGIIRGRFSATEQARDEPKTFYTCDDFTFKAAKLSDSGHFSCVYSVLIPDTHVFYRGSFDGGLLCESYWSENLHNQEGNDFSLAVVSTKDGRLQGSIALPSHSRSCLSSNIVMWNRGKLFVGVQPDNCVAAEDYGLSIAAYLTHEPC